MLCDNCKSVVGENTRFCENCGKEVLKNDYPTVTLASSGPMKYRKTNLDIARLDLESVRIDLNEEYSSYVIPTSDTFSSANTVADEEMNRKVRSENINSAKDVALQPKRQNYVQNNRAVDYNLQDLQSAPVQNASAKQYNRSVNNNMPAYWQQNQNVQRQQIYKNNVPVDNKKIELSGNGIKELVMAFVAMMFMALPLLSLAISIVTLEKIAKLEKSANLKTVAAMVAGFVAVISLLMIFVNSAF